LLNYICHAETKSFQPANITFDLLQPLDEATRSRVRDKKQRHAMVCARALRELEGWLRTDSGAKVCQQRRVPATGVETGR
jgi:methylenetetrahydrofolate--tRNA-(uracil-5-)-methyltransferase